MGGWAEKSQKHDDVILEWSLIYCTRTRRMWVKLSFTSLYLLMYYLWGKNLYLQSSFDIHKMSNGKDKCEFSKGLVIILVQKLIILFKKYCNYKLCFHKQELFQVSHSSRHYFRDQSPRQWQLCSPNRATKLIRLVWTIRKATLSYHIVSYLFSFL